MSLADQLVNISQASEAVALDRKRRSKLHSVSFLYDPHYAATQDFETIFADSSDALMKLEALDSRFTRFRDTIFSEFSIGIDRQTQTKEQNENLDRTINAFLSLVAPYWHLAISIKAAEWPLRRFSMNVYNAEYILLTTLPYFDQPVFERILYVIPKLPTMFQWLTGFKKAGRCPARTSLTRAFADIDFFSLYSKFINEEAAHHNQYRKQLVFFVTMSVSAMAALSSGGSHSLSEFISLSLESASSLLSSGDNESRVSAYTILAVVSSSVPLSRDVILASIDTILLSSTLTSAAFRCILKLFQNIQSDPLNPLPPATMEKLPVDLFASESSYLPLLKSTPYSNRFSTSCLRALIKSGKGFESDALDSLKDAYFSGKQLALLEEDALDQVRSAEGGALAPLFRFLAAENKDAFRRILKQSKTSLNDLEMLLQTTIFETSCAEEVREEVVVVEKEPPKKLSQQLEDSKTEVVSFLVSDRVVNETFQKLQGLFLKSISQQSVGAFLRICFTGSDAIVSFLLRVAVDSNVPLRGRTYALKMIRITLESLDQSTLIYQILPVLSTLFLDQAASIREGACDLLMYINNRGPSSTKTILLKSIYGSDNTAAMISPKDGSLFVSKLAENAQMFKLDADSFVKSFDVGGKRLAQVVLAFYASHAIKTNIPDIKAKLMKITSSGCSLIKGASSPAEIFNDFLSGYLKTRDQWLEACVETGSDFDDFEKQVLNLVGEEEKNESAIALIEDALTSSFDRCATLAKDRLVAIFPSLQFGDQIRIINCVLERGLADNSSVVYDPVELLESLHLTDDIFVQLLKGSVVGASTQQQGNVPKRRRRSSASTRQAMKETEVSSLANVHLRKVTVLLDVLYHFSLASSFRPSLDLLKLLFTILDDLETLGMDGKLPVLYSQETLASCMSNVVESLKYAHTSINDTSAIRADIIVSSIRSSDSPQAQNKLLLVIAALASLSPELVLHSVMPIFTFMGAHTIRQDDEFSTHVVEETILCVIPALASTAKSGMAEEVDFLLTSFVGAFPHIPRHRRVRLFTTLARTLGSQLSVHLILFLCGQQYAAAYAKHNMANCSALIDFSSTFLQSFAPEEQLDSARKYISLWKEIPENVVAPDSQVFVNLTSRVIFGPSIVAMNKSELYNLRKGLVSYLRHSLIDSKTASGIPKLRLKMASEFLQNDDQLVLDIFSGLIKDILGLIDEYSNSFEDEEILKKFYKLLGNVLSLLPIQYFVKSIASTLTSSSNSLRTKRHVASLTSAKFELERADNPYAYEGVSTIVSVLLDNISSERDVELSQASFDALASFFQRFSDHIDSSLMMRSLEVAVGEAGILSTEAPELIVSSINCITSIVAVTGVKMIGYFPKIVAPLYGVFDGTAQGEEESSKLIQTSILVLFSTLVRKIPNFVTPNVKGFVDVTFRANLVSNAVKNSVLMTVVDHVDPKTVLPAFCNLWTKVSGLDSATIGLFLSALEIEIEKMEKKTAVSQSGTFIRFFLRALEFKGASEFDINTVNRIESDISKCGIQYVLKLNDKTFRPLFASIVRWAFDGEGASSSINEIDRLQSFFKFFNKLEENLRSIITSYYSYLLDSTESLLDRFSSGTIVNISLRRSVFISLTSSFKYDQSEYWQASTRFDPISKALCAQLVNIEDTIGKHLVKAITALVQDASSEDHNKQVNDLLMLHMKAECKPKEKVWAVKTLKNIYKKVGESWLSLLPQLVPLIAELLEDDDEEVEMEVRTGLAKVIERVMGEPLDRYLE
ncbi:DEKNAAC102253 [Brettanomyces naardenensis]|uniref:U3 small nucleolar RNA-associated protein 10 n=1 Tax=Brettanomyces naardenensis TaxID=13370 RepID=A0A448YKJ8_BRENA|nr:DEKNAAC102253 [Brettanomyces naardenensis]